MAGEHLLVIDDSPTLLKVVESALTQAGYRVDVAADGVTGLELVRRTPTVPDLILLDGLIPGSDPVEICGQLASDAALARVPVVVMATRDDALEARFARAPNVVDYISKPFSPDALRAVVSNAVGGRAAAPPGAGGIVREAAAPEATAPEGRTGPTAASDAAVAEALSLSTSPDAAGRPAPALSGDVAVVSLGEILSMLGERAQTGILRVVNATSGARIEIVFRAGKIDLAHAVGVAEEFLLGRFAVERGDVPAAALDAVVAERRKATTKPPLFGADLVARGLLTEAKLARVMRRQTTELVYETLRWTTGTFELRLLPESRLPSGAPSEPAVLALARAAALAIEVDRLLLEGYRRVDEWRVIGNVVAGSDQVYVRDDDRVAALPPGTFTREELAVLENVDGRRSVREIVKTLRLGSFDVSKVLFRLLRARLIRPRVAPVAT